MSHPYLVPAGMLLHNLVKHTSREISNYTQFKINEYCKKVTIEDCKLAQEYNSYLSPIVGLSLGVGTAIAFIETVSNSSPTQKAFETVMSSILLGAVGTLASYTTDCIQE